MKQLILIFLLSIPYWLYAQSMESHSLYGTVHDGESGLELPGATIKIKDSNKGMVTDAEGRFSIDLDAGEYTLVLSYLGYETKELSITVPISEALNILLYPSQSELQAVEVVSTGYQELPKERATGSFVQMDKQLINRRVGADILDRLEDVTPGLVFNRVGSKTERISIRGRGTIFADASPLIVLDGFPYDGPIENINPNDVEAITVLRDAAAASIWGARAGNGVIVITTKKGSRDQSPRISFNTNLTVAERPDSFYLPRLNTADYVDWEQRLFEQGFYESAEMANDKQPLTPVIETLIAARDGLLSPQEADARIANYKALDVRRDYRDYLYRPSLAQQHNLSLSGGSQKQTYYLSLGYDRKEENLVENYQERFTIQARHQTRFLKDRLQWENGIYIVQATRVANNTGPEALRFDGLQPLYPYAQLADKAGNPLSITEDFRESFKRDAEAAGLLDWSFAPLEEIHLIDNRRKELDMRLQTGLSFELHSNLKASLRYQYWTNLRTTRNFADEASYYARNLVNRFTQQGDEGELTYPIPRGGIMDLGDLSSHSHTLRAQLAYNNTWNDKHDLDMLAGYEARSARSEGFSNILYGYDPETGNNYPVDYISRFPQYYRNAISNNIPYGTGNTGTVDNFISYYANLAYAFKKQYTLTASARKDASNLFGVDANQKAVPLWSVGAGYVLSAAPFMKSKWIDYMRLRATYGENGNVHKGVTAFTTARVYGVDRYSGLTVSTLTNPPNPDLQWERIKILNLALEFDLWEDRISGSVEWYRKAGDDLIGEMPFAPNTGIESFRGNFAATRTKGWDIQLRSSNLNGKLQWNTDLIYSHVDEKILDYQQEGSVLEYLGQGAGAQGTNIVFPMTGRPLLAVYSLPWAGLDSETGDPMGYLDGQESTDYTAIINSASPETLIYNGSAKPTHFGALRNTFAYKGFSLSFNIAYRLGYYYRRPSVRYNTIMQGQGGHADYYRRWQEPSDEARTQIPSLPESRDPQRDNFHAYSESLVEKADHIRLQDIRFSYTLEKSRLPALPFQRAEFYTYANNLGIIWKSAKDDPLDPDFRTAKPLRSIAVGVKASF
ncbi:SusC/RagA family TonB-linked outer membrane protein [Echinicola marina]|uniref:SusC/RagA family TonB-linked outer membrane protein n=1 Tax=Echinicola marina TaxID=2859768 RepID=UPI001CF69F13|nr:SusC/RagA family TonB-linked outer membrane protein [Echinicola marina]UCS91968.1 SusC/RagA family TonB-linked outer membrane protein [Echinicola marina]